MRMSGREDNTMEEERGKENRERSGQAGQGNRKEGGEGWGEGYV